MSEAIPVIVNPGAGVGDDVADGLLAEIAAAFRAAGAEARIIVARDGEAVTALAREEAARAPAKLVAGGGDGTIGAVASIVAGSDIALGVLPLGTLNHFAKDLGIPLAPAEAARVVVEGRVVRIDIGEVNDRLFVNNSSLGLYPHIVRKREMLRRRLGTGKWPALFWAVLTAVRRRPFFNLRLTLDGEERVCRTPLVFIGNNEYLFDGFNPGRRDRLDAGVLFVYLALSRSRWALLRLGLRALLGRLHQEQDFEAYRARTLVVESRRHRIRVATDGEVRRVETPLHYRIRAADLRVIVPLPEAA